jgi:excisionase family DNA binding protein
MVVLHEIGPAAKRLHVVSETLRKWAREGRIAHARIGGRLLFSDEHLAEFIRANTVPAQQRAATP